MKSLTESKEKIVHFWEIEEDSEQDAFLEEIRQYANSQEDRVFIEEVRRNFELVPSSGVTVIYYALSTIPERWSLSF